MAVPKGAIRRTTRIYKPHILPDAEKALFIIESAFKRLSHSLDSLRPQAREKSTWSDYMGTHSYDDPAFAAKEEFVNEALAQFKPRRVLDAAWANTGHFSVLAAQSGAEVVAIDLDPVCVGQIFGVKLGEKIECSSFGYRSRSPQSAARLAKR